MGTELPQEESLGMAPYPLLTADKVAKPWSTIQNNNNFALPTQQLSTPYSSFLYGFTGAEFPRKTDIYTDLYVVLKSKDHTEMYLIS